MKIEDIKIEDAADANYVIRKFFNDQFKEMKMSRLEQLVLTVYNMGKNSASAGSESPEPQPSPKTEASTMPDSPPEIEEPAMANPFNISEKVKALEDIEIAHSGELIKAGTVGTVSSVNEETVLFLFESDEDGEMIEASVPFQKLEKM